MFSQKKKFYEKRSFYIGLMAVLVAFGVWINQTPGDADKEEGRFISRSEDEMKEDDAKDAASQDGIQTNKNVITGENSATDNRRSPAVMDEENVKKDEEKDPEEEDEKTYNQWTDYPYYLIQEEEGTILAYYLDLGGQPTLVRTTSIAFHLLSETDQQLFREGIRIETQEEMMDLLQDFES